jgi:hypothetical protein
MTDKEKRKLLDQWYRENKPKRDSYGSDHEYLLAIKRHSKQRQEYLKSLGPQSLKFKENQAIKQKNRAERNRLRKKHDGNRKDKQTHF